MSPLLYCLLAALFVSLHACGQVNEKCRDSSMVSGIPMNYCPPVPMQCVPTLLSYGFQPASAGTRSVDVVVIHSVYNPLRVDSFAVDGVLQLFKRYGVSAHYLIDRQGTVYQLIKENDVSWHGGKGSLPDGGTLVNTRSIGIELINSMHSTPDSAQYKSLARLVLNIYDRHDIRYLLGHHHTAPGRKSDPWNFDWVYFDCLLEEEYKRLYDASEKNP